MLSAPALAPRQAPRVAIPAIAEEPRPAAETARSAPADPPKPAPAEVTRAPEAPKPAPATAQTPAQPAAPAATVNKAETPAPSPAPAVPQKAAALPKTPPAPNPNDEVERLRKAADLMVQVNSALGVPQSPYGQIIYDIAIRHSINPHLVAALIHVESAFNPRAVSPMGAYGLMQLLPETARRFGLNRKKDLFDPKKNLEAGVRYLKWLADRFGGDAQKILAAYNAGEGAVERFGGIPPYQETQNYVQKIFGLLGFAAAVPAPALKPAATPNAQESVAAR
ncbi:MAG TPA: lytic transglycosylase domain-containing protein [Thermoanaerobaculia bacterium]